MSNPESGNFDEIIESLQSDDSLEQGKLIYSAADMGVPLREMMGYRSDGESQFVHITQNCDVATCHPVADKFRLPAEWVTTYWDLHGNDAAIHRYISEQKAD
jgi:hypothetical protein